MLCFRKYHLTTQKYKYINICNVIKTEREKFNLSKRFMHRGNFIYALVSLFFNTKYYYNY